jgi:hypothetical protein
VVLELFGESKGIQIGNFISLFTKRLNTSGSENDALMLIRNGKCNLHFPLEQCASMYEILCLQPNPNQVFHLYFCLQDCETNVDLIRITGDIEFLIWSHHRRR